MERIEILNSRFKLPSQIILSEIMSNWKFKKNSNMQALGILMVAGRRSLSTFTRMVFHYQGSGKH